MPCVVIASQCFVTFCLFASAYPQLVEGFTNAGVALEKLNRADDALALYQYAHSKFPDHKKPYQALLNLLEAQVVHYYTTQK